MLDFLRSSSGLGPAPPKHRSPDSDEHPKHRDGSTLHSFSPPHLRYPPLPMTATFRPFVLAFTLGTSLVCAAEDPRLLSVQAADDARIAAMQKPSPEALQTILSDALRYAHSNGLVDTKTSLIDSLVQGKTRYLQMQYEEREFTFPAPEVALMSGRVKVHVQTPTAEITATLLFLGAWKLEKGAWRFLAWQSCKIPPAQP